jgi:hypothetical protein
MSRIMRFFMNAISWTNKILLQIIAFMAIIYINCDHINKHSKYMLLNAINEQLFSPENNSWLNKLQSFP